MHRSFWLTVLLIVISVTSFSQSSSDRSTLTGIIHDQTGAAIAGAKVELSSNHILKQSTTTDQSGSFRLNRLPPGKYQVQVTSQGFEPATLDVTIGSQPLASLITCIKSQRTFRGKNSPLSSQRVNSRFNRKST